MLSHMIHVGCLIVRDKGEYLKIQPHNLYATMNVFKSINFKKVSVLANH